VRVWGGQLNGSATVTNKTRQRGSTLNFGRHARRPTNGSLLLHASCVARHAGSIGRRFTAWGGGGQRFCTFLNNSKETGLEMSARLNPHMSEVCFKCASYANEE
jgi:hypothetical protein